MEPWDLEDWEFDDLLDWENFEVHQDFLNEVTFLLADRFFLSDNDYLPNAEEDYNLGHLRPEAWWSLVNQLDEMVNAWVEANKVDVKSIQTALSHEVESRAGSGDLLYTVIYRADEPVP